MKKELSLELTYELIEILEGRNWDALDEFVCQYGYDEGPRCPNCNDVLDLDREQEGFPCGECTETQPVGVWVGKWEPARASSLS